MRGLTDSFPKRSALDTRIEYVRPQIRILRRNLLTNQNAEVYRSASRSKYQEFIDRAHLTVQSDHAFEAINSILLKPR